MRRLLRGLLGLLLLSGPVYADPCADFAVGSKVEVTDAGATALCKTATWKRTGTVTNLTVKGCPDCVKVKRGLVTSESIHCQWLRLLPEPVPIPTPTPTPTPTPPPASSQVLPLPLTRPVTVPYPVSGGVPFAQGVLTNRANLLVESNGQPVPAQFRELATWPDGSLRAVLVTLLAQPGTAYSLRYGEGVSHQIGALVPPSPLLGTYSLKIGTTTHAFVKTGETVEEQGHVSTTVRYDGTIGPVGMRIRQTSYAGTDLVLVEPTILGTQDEQSASNPPGKFLQADAYEWTLPAALSGQAYTLEGDAGKLAGTVDGPKTLLQTGDVIHDTGGWFSKFLLGYTGPGNATGTKAQGWAETPTLSVAVRHFWQQYPKALRLSPNGLTVSFHPAEYTASPQPASKYTRPRTFYFNRAGMAKTYQVLVKRNAGIEPVYDLLQDPPRLLPDQAYIASTKVFGELLPAGAYSAGYDKVLTNDIYQRSIQEPKAIGSVAYPFGWRDWGDAYRHSNEANYPMYNGTHVGATLYCHQYLRTRDVRWWELCENQSRHVMDLDVSHVGRNGHPYLPNLGPGELLAIKHDNYDHEERNLHFGHAHLSGLADYYLLTGDRRAREVLDEMAGWWVRGIAQAGFFKVPAGGFSDANPHVAEAERDYAWPLFVMNEAYRATGNKAYHDAATHMVKHRIAWWQWKTAHKLNGQVLGTNDWQAGTGYWTLYPKSDNGSSGTNGCQPWMAAPGVSSVIKWLEDDYAISALTNVPSLDHQLVRTMIFQLMNYLVKWGYTKPNLGYFIYVEGSTTNGGDVFLYYPMAWVVREVQRGTPAPAWLDELATMKRLVLDRYQRAATYTYAGSTASGFYGYEMIFPMDFWAVAKDITP